MDTKKLIIYLVNKELGNYNNPIPKINEVFGTFIKGQFCDLAETLYLFYKAFSGKKPDKKIILLGSALELSKYYGFVLDDVVDDDKTRGGKPAFHLLVKKTLGISIKASKNITIYYSLLIRQIAKKYFLKFNFSSLFEKVDKIVSIGQIKEEVGKPNKKWRDVYTQKAYFSALPIILASKLSKKELKNDTIERFIILEQRIGDLYDLAYKHADIKKLSNTSLLSKFGETNSTKILKNLNKGKYNNIISREFEDIKKEIISLRSCFSDISRNPAPAVIYYKKLLDYLEKIKSDLNFL